MCPRNLYRRAILPPDLTSKETGNSFSATTVFITLSHLSPSHDQRPVFLPGCGKKSNRERRLYPQRLKPAIVTITYGRPEGRPLQQFSFSAAC